VTEMKEPQHLNFYKESSNSRDSFSLLQKWQK